jgi:hypothetical protein
MTSAPDTLPAFHFDTRAETADSIWRKVYAYFATGADVAPIHIRSEESSLLVQCRFIGPIGRKDVIFDQLEQDKFDLPNGGRGLFWRHSMTPTQFGETLHRHLVEMRRETIAPARPTL